jgi:hypothetical protein
MSLELCHPASPRRAVDWRWRAATCLRNRLLPAHPAWSDPWVARILAFQESLDDHDGDPNHPGSVEPDPALAAAYELHLDEDRPARWHVEALLLAGEGDDSIAGCCGIPAAVVAAYASVFFDIRARLERTSYFHHQVINVNQGRPGHSVGRAWKLLGYGGGPLVVDFMAAGVEDAGRIGGFAVVGPRAPQDRHARLRRMAVAALTLELDPASARRLVPLIGALEEIDERASATSPIDGTFAAMVAGLDGVPGDAERGGNGLVAQEGIRPAGEIPTGVVQAEDREDLFETAPLRGFGA